MTFAPIGLQVASVTLELEQDKEVVVANSPFAADGVREIGTGEFMMIVGSRLLNRASQHAYS